MAKAKKPTEQFYVWQRAKNHPSKKPYVVLCGQDGDASEETVTVGEYATLAKAEEHAARLNAANEPPPPIRYFCLIEQDDDEGIRHVVATDRPLVMSDRTQAIQIVNALNQLVQDFADGVVG